MKLKLQLLVTVVAALLTAMIILSSIAKGASRHSIATAEQPTTTERQTNGVPAP